MKNGKKPVEERQEFLSSSSVFGGSELSIPGKMQAYLTKHNLGCKWLSTHHLKKNGGRHKRGWVPFKLPEELKDLASNNPYSGTNSEFFEVGDLVLGTKPLTNSNVSVENHRRYLRQETRLATMEAMGTDGQGNPIIRTEDK